MTTQHQTIAICVLALLAIPVGGFTTYKLINRLTRAPVNTLVRPGDIELDYIEPSQPAHIYQPIDLENTHYINLESISNWRDRVPSYFSGQPAPSYYSGTLPQYQSVDNLYIHSSLEKKILLI